eukprot:2840779-Pleurochrysis_carterae.AAC.5
MPSEINCLGIYRNCRSALIPTISCHGFHRAPTDQTRCRYSQKLAQAVFFSLCTSYSLDAPSHIASSTFVFPFAPAAHATATPTTCSAPASAAPAAATPAAKQPVGTGIPPFSAIRALSSNEKDHFVISPAKLASVDRQLMKYILGTITSPSSQPAYGIQCQKSDRALFSILVARANVSSASAGLAIKSMMESPLLKGLSEASLWEFDALHHAFIRLNRSVEIACAR